MSKKGFTLVELIVVIAIISILAVIGFTAYAGYIQIAGNNTKISLIAEGSRAVERETIIRNIPRCESGAGICWFCKQNTTDCDNGIRTTDWKNAQLTHNPRDFITDYFFIYIHTNTEFQIIGTDRNNKAIVKGNTNKALYTLPDLDDADVVDNWLSQFSEPIAEFICLIWPHLDVCQTPEPEPIDELLEYQKQIVNQLGGPGDIINEGDIVPYTLIQYEQEGFISLLDLYMGGE